MEILKEGLAVASDVGLFCIRTFFIRFDLGYSSVVVCKPPSSICCPKVVTCLVLKALSKEESGRPIDREPDTAERLAWDLAGYWVVQGKVELRLIGPLSGE